MRQYRKVAHDGGGYNSTTRAVISVHLILQLATARAFQAQDPHQMLKQNQLYTAIWQIDYQ